MAKALRLLLLDANVVIELHRLGLWSQVIDRCDVMLTGGVVAESKYFEIGAVQHRVDLQTDIAQRRITYIAPELSTIHAFRSRFQPSFLERLDAGEAESLACLVEVDSNCMISSADKIVWRTLGALRCGEQGISLEEILGRIGLTKQMPPQFSRSYREEWTRKGFQEGLQGEALK